MLASLGELVPAAPRACLGVLAQESDDS